MGYLFWLTVLAAFVLAGLTIYQAYDKVQSDNDAIQEKKTADQERKRADEARKETKISQDKAEKYLNSLKEANEKIQKLNYESLHKADEIIRKNEEVIKAQTETIRSVTGFGTPIAVVGRQSGNNGSFYVVNNGNYNFKNLNIDIFDFSDDLKSHLKDNKLSNDLMQKHLLGKESVVNLPPNQTLQGSHFFDINQFKAFEVRIYTDHGEFREFFISKFNKSNGLAEHYYYKLFEIDRSTMEWHLIEQKPQNNSMDALFEKYFIMHNYMMTSENF